MTSGAEKHFLIISCRFWDTERQIEAPNVWCCLHNVRKHPSPVPVWLNAFTHWKCVLFFLFLFFIVIIIKKIFLNCSSTRVWKSNLFGLSLNFPNFCTVNKCIVQSQLLCRTDVTSPQQQHQQRLTSSISVSLSTESCYYCTNTLRQSIADQLSDLLFCFLSEASNCPTAILKYVLNRPCFSSLWVETM